MTFAVQQRTFEGPLDLLLHLVQKEKLDITEIALAEVTESYLEHVEQLRRSDIPQISDFLVIAARLLLLKSRALLWEETAEEEEPDDLTAQLQEYRHYKELAQKLELRLAEPIYSHAKKPATGPASQQLVTDGVSLAALHQAFAEVMRRLPTETTLPQQQLEETITLEERMADISSSLARAPQAFTQLFQGLSTRVSLIVTFLALLELFKQSAVKFAGAGAELQVAAR